MPETINIKTICVCGAGTMGSGIAQVAAQAGFNTIQFDLNTAMLEKSRQQILASLNKLAEKGKLTEAAKTAALANIHFTASVEACIADVIIEAIVEDEAAKTTLFKKLAAINSPATIFATNTSSISVSTLATATAIDAQFAGMHFFNPAQLMKLVEVVYTSSTAPAVTDTLVALAKQMGKVPVVCKDAPGFIVNRVARHYYLEAMLLVEKGLADIETIDTIMEATGFKMGPFKLMDLIGMDVNYAVSNIVWNALDKPERLQPSALQKEKVEKGELGKKSGKGFYHY
ncbi:3-hydroxybutyryl-CoA dehydrogenase [Panacibacter sp. DH6]|uniref:3-hydroxybutyryl-CoA dehydrogenase n=1 Tax=Panacibacter microcysteis TaxID=2793269 RepID=A0A931E4Y3_9BACT|nr:3-hydroxyacyl-CoA dehydrogenase NAD-binding domain-containing protein [Panacibacter microcysteis]MBG9375365.1 3-hydroxybutyryl-CoA dehydrogenase [Panacibacter microcysteis]